MSKTNKPYNDDDESENFTVPEQYVTCGISYMICLEYKLCSFLPWYRVLWKRIFIICGLIIWNKGFCFYTERKSTKALNLSCLLKKSNIFLL